MKNSRLKCSLLLLMPLSFAQAQNPVPRNAMVELLKENPPKLPVSCLDPAYGPVEVEILQTTWLLTGCDEELTYLILSLGEDVSSLSSFTFGRLEERYSLLLPAPIESRALAMFDAVADLSEGELNRFANRLRRAENE